MCCELQLRICMEDLSHHQNHFHFLFNVFLVAISLSMLATTSLNVVFLTTEQIRVLK